MKYLNVYKLLFHVVEAALTPHKKLNKRKPKGRNMARCGPSRYDILSMIGFYNIFHPANKIKTAALRAEEMKSVTRRREREGLAFISCINEFPVWLLKIKERSGTQQWFGCMGEAYGMFREDAWDDATRKARLDEQEIVTPKSQEWSVTKEDEDEENGSIKRKRRREGHTKEAKQKPVGQLVIDSLRSPTSERLGKHPSKSQGWNQSWTQSWNRRKNPHPYRTTILSSSHKNQILLRHPQHIQTRNPARTSLSKSPMLLLLLRAKVSHITKPPLYKQTQLQKPHQESIPRPARELQN